MDQLKALWHSEVHNEQKWAANMVKSGFSCDRSLTFYMSWIEFQFEFKVCMFSDAESVNFICKFHGVLS